MSDLTEDLSAPRANRMHTVEGWFASHQTGPGYTTKLANIRDSRGVWHDTAKEGVENLFAVSRRDTMLCQRRLLLRGAPVQTFSRC